MCSPGIVAASGLPLHSAFHCAWLVVALGTLYVKEIGDVSVHTQALFRVLRFAVVSDGALVLIDLTMSASNHS